MVSEGPDVFSQCRLCLLLAPPGGHFLYCLLELVSLIGIWLLSGVSGGSSDVVPAPTHSISQLTPLRLSLQYSRAQQLGIAIGRADWHTEVPFTRGD